MCYKRQFWKRVTHKNVQNGLFWRSHTDLETLAFYLDDVHCQYGAWHSCWHPCCVPNEEMSCKCPASKKQASFRRVCLQKRIPNWPLTTKLQFFNHLAIVNIIMLHSIMLHTSALYLNMLCFGYFVIHKRTYGCYWQMETSVCKKDFVDYYLHI